MTKITFSILTHKCFKNGKYIFSVDNNKYKTDTVSMEKLLQKIYGKNAKRYTGKWTFKELPKPNSYPLFSNEIDFYLKLDGKRINNPEILEVRWDGKEWAYRLRNIGHEYDYLSEAKLTKI